MGREFGTDKSPFRYTGEPKTYIFKCPYLAEEKPSANNPPFSVCGMESFAIELVHKEVVHPDSYYRRDPSFGRHILHKGICNLNSGQKRTCIGQENCDTYNILFSHESKEDSRRINSDTRREFTDFLFESPDNLQLV